MIDQTLSGYGSLGNDLYAPLDVAYASDLPQREQDIEQAKSLLASAGQDGLQVELFTGDGIGSVAVPAANLFAEQAKEAGVEVKVTKKTEFYDDDYLSYPFAQDFWNTRNYIPQAVVGTFPGSSVAPTTRRTGTTRSTGTWSTRPRPSSTRRSGPTCSTRRRRSSTTRAA